MLQAYQLSIPYTFLATWKLEDVFVGLLFMVQEFLLVATFKAGVASEKNGMLKRRYEKIPGTRE